MMFRNLTLRSKLFTIVAAVAVLFGSTFVVLSRMANRHLANTMQSEIERSTKVAAEYISSRFRQLDAGLHSLVDSSEIRAILTSEGIDHDTILMSITDLQNLLSADAILYCNAKGQTLARTDSPFESNSNVSDLPLVAQALKGDVSQGLWQFDETYLLAIAFPVTLDGQVEGVVIAGLSLSKDADQLRSLLLRDVVLRHSSQELASSVKTPLFTSSSQRRPESSVLSSCGLTNLTRLLPKDIRTAEDVYRIPSCRLATPTGQSEFVVICVDALPEQESSLQAVVFVPMQSVFGYVNEFQRILFLMGAMTLGVSIAVTMCIGSFITSQVQNTLKVLQQVATGDLAIRLKISSKDEFGRIAAALNTAIEASYNTTNALTRRNNDIKTLLDAVEQGFFTVNAKGVMSDERSGAVDRNFGAPVPNMKFSDFIAQFDSKVADWIEMGLEEVFSEILPIEVTLDQLPSRFQKGRSTFSLKYSAILIEGRLASIAVVISDITNAVEIEVLESAKREMLSIVQRVAEDRSGFLEFFREAEAIVSALRDGPNSDVSLVKRRVHTLKGNTSIFGLDRIAKICHEIESFLAETPSQHPQELFGVLFETWRSVSSNVRMILGDCSPLIALSEDEHADFLRKVVSSSSREELVVHVLSWKLEPTEQRLTRIAEQTKQLAKRLQKGDIEVITRAGNLRLEPSKWSDFWSAFIHVIRNAIDHGLETPKERIAVGKSPAGRIEISTLVQNNRFVVSLSDDGNGIHWERIKAEAIQKGLPVETHSDLTNAVFEEGLSSAQSISENSGRGVGLAAIKTSCESLGGEISIESELGKGTVFHFNFPISSMASDAKELLLLSEITDVQSLIIPNSTLVKSERFQKIGICTLSEHA